MAALHPGDIISNQIALTGTYEPELSRRIREMALRGGFFVDVGANLGYFTLLWLAARKENHVLSIEASPRNQEFLKRNFQQNGVQDRVEVLMGAAGNQSGMATFDPGPDSQTGWGGLSPPQASKNTVRVQVFRLDEVIHSPVDFLKIDVEGADTWVLEGCEALLREQKIRLIHFEQNEDRMKGLGIKPGAAMQFLQGLNYRCERLSEMDWLAHPN